MYVVNARTPPRSVHDLAHSDGERTESPRRPFERRVGGQPLHEHDAVGPQVASTHLEELDPAVPAGVVDQVTQREHDVEAFVEVEGPEVGEHCPHADNVFEHLGRVVDRDDIVARHDERVGDATGTAAEIEDTRPPREQRFHTYEIVAGLEREVDRDRTAVGRDVGGHQATRRASSTARTLSGISIDAFGPGHRPRHR